MKTFRVFSGLFIFLMVFNIFEASGQWLTNGNHIYNSNSGNVGIGDNSPSTLLHVKKNMTEPTITVQNLGGNGGATYAMVDAASGANWKFKATLNGGFKIRDHANLMDVFVIEPNSFANAIYITTSNNVGIGTSTPHPSALLDLTSTNKGFLPPRMTTSQIQAIANPANGLIVYCTSDQKYYAYRSTTAVWKEIQFGAGTLSPANPCGSTFIANHAEGAVAPVSKTVTYGTVFTDITGTDKCWITQNLGADYQAGSEIDPNEPPAGWYWQFNKQQGFKHDGTNRTPNSTWITSISENSDWMSGNDPCALLLGGGWRLPTNTEYFNADLNGGWDNGAEAYSSVLKLHRAGTIINGSLVSRGAQGRYWSSTQISNTSGYYLDFAGSFSYTNYVDKHRGQSVRCIKD
jgi:hypothetical protein